MRKFVFLLCSIMLFVTLVSGVFAEQNIVLGKNDGEGPTASAYGETDNYSRKGEVQLRSSLSPSAVILTKFIPIGSGLVDLETSINANMGITSVSGSHYYQLKGDSARVDSISGFNQSPVPFYSRTSQWTETPGKKVDYVGSDGSVLFNWTYTRTWDTVMYDYIGEVL